MFRSTNVPFDQCSVRPMFHSTNVPSTKVHSTKVSSTNKVPQPFFLLFFFNPYTLVMKFRRVSGIDIWCRLVSTTDTNPRVVRLVSFSCKQIWTELIVFRLSETWSSIPINVWWWSLGKNYVDPLMLEILIVVTLLVVGSFGWYNLIGISGLLWIMLSNSISTLILLFAKHMGLPIGSWEAQFVVRGNSLYLVCVSYSVYSKVMFNGLK